MFQAQISSCDPLRQQYDDKSACSSTISDISFHPSQDKIVLKKIFFRRRFSIDRMWKSSPTHQSSPHTSRPSSPDPGPNDEGNDDGNDQRNDNMAGDESAPLLPSHGRPTRRLTPTKVINFLTPLALSFAINTLVLLVIDAITMAILYYGSDMPRETSEAVGSIWIPVGSPHTIDGFFNF